MNKFNSAGGGDQMQIRLIPGAIEQFRENSREGGRDIYTSMDAWTSYLGIPPPL